MDECYGELSEKEREPLRLMVRGHDAIESSARDWLVQVDAFDWDDSFAASGRPFRDPNTLDCWREAS